MIYLQMPRTASTHTMALLDHNWPNHKNTHDHEPLGREPRKGELIFGTVRDPFDWYLSAWSGNLVPCLGYLRANDEDPAYFRTWMKELDSEDIRRNVKSDIGPMGQGLYSHLALKTYTHKGEWVTDKFIRAEDYRATFKSILGEHEDPFDYQFNASNRKWPNVFYYDEETRDRVRRNDHLVATHLGYPL